TGPKPIEADSDFCKKHRVFAIVAGPITDEHRDAAVVIAGRTYRIGDVLDGYKLTQIDPDAERPFAVFEGEGRRVKLSAPLKPGVKEPTDKQAQDGTG